MVVANLLWYSIGIDSVRGSSLWLDRHHIGCFGTLLLYPRSSKERLLIPQISGKWLRPSQSTLLKLKAEMRTYVLSGKARPLLGRSGVCIGALQLSQND